MMTLDVNWFAVVVAAAAAMVLGYLWYGPIFGKAWISAMGKTREELGSPGPAMILTVVAALITAAVLAMVLAAVGAQSIGDGVAWGLLAAAGFVATSHLTNSVYEGKNPTVTVLFIVYQLVSMAVMGAILAAWT